jgi:general stress protein 26
MAIANPVADIDSRFSSADATPTSWAEGRQVLEQAEVFWLATVRPNGRPHVTPLLAIWQDGALYFSTGPDEQKARNLTHNPRCVLTTGCNSLEEGLDLVIEGDAVLIEDEATLRRLADQYATKYGWQFSVRDGAFYNDHGGEALVYAVPPTRAFGFGKGDTYSQTRWRF